MHIVYDSRSDARSDSPETSGIPCRPVRVFSSRAAGARHPARPRQQLPAPAPAARQQGGYTSDESSDGVRHRTAVKKEKIIWA